MGDLSDSGTPDLLIKIVLICHIFNISFSLSLFSKKEVCDGSGKGVGGWGWVGRDGEGEVDYRFQINLLSKLFTYFTIVFILF